MNQTYLGNLSDHYYKDDLATLYLGDCRDVLRSLPDESVQCVVTSPPYWGLRDYGVAAQLGLEGSPDEYVETIVDVFREVRRVLKADGTLWLNMGDSYVSSPKGNLNGRDKSGLTSTQTQESSIVGFNKGTRPTFRRDRAVASPGAHKRVAGLKPKDLIGIPWRVAFALQADGWWLRQDIIWAKPNPMPESVRDRPTTAHEYVFLMSKSKSYFYNFDEAKEQVTGNAHARGTGVNPKAQAHPKGWSAEAGGHSEPTGHYPKPKQNESFSAAVNGLVPDRNRRSVWTIPSVPSTEKHFASYPPELVRPCILAGTKESDTVLDPFAGTFTTGQVAKELHRNVIGIELSPDYCEIAQRRISRARVGMPLEPAAATYEYIVNAPVDMADKFADRLDAARKRIERELGISVGPPNIDAFTPADMDTVTDLYIQDYDRR